MLKRFALFLAVSLLVLGALAACGGGEEAETDGDSGSASGTAGSVTVDMTEMKFTPATIETTPGQTLEVTLTNSGSVVHDLTIDDFGGERIHEVVDPGGETTITLEVPADGGTWDFYCSQPGHQAAGMVGVLEAAQ